MKAASNCLAQQSRIYSYFNTWSLSLSVPVYFDTFVFMEVWLFVVLAIAVLFSVLFVTVFAMPFAIMLAILFAILSDLADRPTQREVHGDEGRSS